MSDKVFNVLFICTGNSARSIMAEAILNRVGAQKFQAFSAGSNPAAAIHAETRDLLRRLHYDVDALHPKSWDQFRGDDAPTMDFVFSLCDRIQVDDCPVWPGQPMNAHWAVPDPLAIVEEGAERGLKLAEIYKMLDRRIGIFVNLRFDALGRLDDIGKN